MNLAKIQTALTGILIGSIGSVVSCTAEVPTTPSFQQHVMPILAANCVRCHSYPALGGAPDYFRLDVFGDVVVRDGRPRTAAEGPCGLMPLDAQGVVCGAVSSAGVSAARSASEKRPMPPRFRIDDHQIETLERWALAPERGAARQDNQAPTASVLLLAKNADSDTLQIEVTIADNDRDLVVGELWLRVGATDRFIGAVRSGTQIIEWSAIGLVAGTYQVAARLDDGAMLHQVPAGQFAIGGSQ